MVKLRSSFLYKRSVNGIRNETRSNLLRKEGKLSKESIKALRLKKVINRKQKNECSREHNKSALRFILTRKVPELIKQQATLRVKLMRQRMRRDYLLEKYHGDFNDEFKTNDILMRASKLSNTRLAHQTYYLNQQLHKLGRFT